MTISCEIEKCLFNSEDDVIGEIIKTIVAATSSIYVMHFWFSWKPIADALIDAHKKGVKINVLTDQRSLVKYMQDNQTTYSISVLEHLSDNGIERLAVYFNHLMHHKIIIVDDVVLTGSLNLFKQSIYENTENIIFIIICIIIMSVICGTTFIATNTAKVFTFFLFSVFIKFIY